MKSTKFITSVIPLQNYFCFFTIKMYLDVFLGLFFFYNLRRETSWEGVQLIEKHDSKQITN